VQRFKAGATATLTARPAAGQSFLGWTGACTGKATICRVKLSTALAVTATFSNRPVKTATLTSLGPPIVRKTSAGYRVTLRFATTAGGTARVRALRAGRVVTTVSARVAAGRVRVGPFPVPLAGLYTFETRLAGDLLRTRACLGTCGAAAPPPPFLLVREPPVVTRSGDVWSVTLHVRANQIYDGRIRALRAGRLLVNQHFLGRAGRVAFGPFLLGRGNYTLRLAAIDAYGRVRALTWIVSLR
jgi:Divergent InlB B-repeat domain